MRRIHAVELHELSITPQPIRETVVETLGRGLRWGGFWTAVAPSFTDFLDRAGCDEVLDLCSGSGEPVACLLDALEARGLARPHFTLTDLLPKPALLDAAARRHPDRIEPVARPVDATAVSSDLQRPARTIFNAFHHFRPDLARSILKDTIASNAAIYILEPFPRSPLRMVATLPPLGAALLATPFVTNSRRLAKTALLPASLLAGLWDATISSLRIHDETDLRAMVADAPHYDWRFEPIPLRGGGLAFAFSGVPSG